MSTTDYKPFTWTHEYLCKVISKGTSAILVKPSHIKAFKSVDRVFFTPNDQNNLAHMDVEVNIGYGQKINRPTIVAQQIKLLDPKTSGRYLEIGGGSGYAAAVIARLVGTTGKVIVLERILPLVERMRINLLNFPELSQIIEVIFKDGVFGYEPEAPYDGILASVAYEKFPDALKNQLKINGVLVSSNFNNDLVVIRRQSVNNFSEELVGGVVFDKIQSGVE